MAGAKRQLSSQRNEAGWSLIEMAIVFMLIGIVLGFAIPVVANSIRAYNLRNAAERLAERLAGGRALAMAKNKNVTVSVATSTGQYGYDFAPAGAPDGTPDTSDPDDSSQSYYVETLPSGISASFAAGGLTLTNGKGIVYTSRGELPIGATQVDIVLTSASKTITVSVNLRGQVWAH
jgi:type II secretory pathway pseudopilin PulG